MYGLLNRRKLKLIGSKVMPIKHRSSIGLHGWIAGIENCFADCKLVKRLQRIRLRG